MNKTLVIGIGNTLLSDDGIGPRVVEALEKEFQSMETEDDPGIDFAVNYSFEIDVLSELSRYENVIIIDSLETGDIPAGTCKVFQMEDFSHLKQEGVLINHGLNLPTLWDFGEKLGIPMPKGCLVIGIKALECKSFSEELSPELGKMFPAIVKNVKDLILNSLR